MKKWISQGFILLTFFLCQLAWADTTADHDALRQLRHSATEALSTNNVDHLVPLLDKSFTIITVDNHKFTNINDFKVYWNAMLSSKDAKLKSIEFNPTADDLTEFLSPDVGIVYGTSADIYHFTDGDARTMSTRWSAVVRKNPEGWKLVSIHFSANIFKNPILSAAKRCAIWTGVIGFIIGLVMAMLAMWCCRCRRTQV